MVKFDGLDDAIIGTVNRFGMESVLLYDMEKCIEILMKNNDWKYEDALEWFEFNIIGAWLGETTPAFAVLEKRD